MPIKQEVSSLISEEALEEITKKEVHSFISKKNYDRILRKFETKEAKKDEIFSYYFDTTMNGLLKTNRSLCFSIKGEAIILQAGIPDGQGSTNFHEEDAFRPQKELEKFFEKEMSHLFYIDSVLTKRTTLDLSDMLGYIHISQSTLPSGYNHHELAVEYHKGLHERASNVFSELLADMKIKQKEQRLPYSLLIDDILKRA